MTLDQAIAMLKKEGLEQDYLWSRFLAENQLSIPILEMLCDEAMDTGNEEMAEELMQLEAAFDVFFEASLVEMFGAELAEGLIGSIFGKKASKKSRTSVGMDTTAAGSGVTVGKGAPGPTGVEPGSQLKLKPVGGKLPKRASQASTIPPKLAKKAGIPVRKAVGEDKMPIEADADDDGNIRMPWQDDAQSSFANLTAKYGGSKNAGAAT